MAVDEAALDAFLETGVEPGQEADAPAAETEVPAAEVEHEIPAAAEEELPSGDSFPREYVEKLRRESASYRERAKRYQEAFDGYEPEAVDEWLGLAQALRTDPQAAAGRFQEIADAIRSQYGDAAGDAAEAELGIEKVEGGVEDAMDKPLTRSEFETLLAEREREADMKARVAQIESDAVTLGYKKGTFDYDKLLWTASRLPSGNIQEAHAHMERERQAVIDSYVKEMGGRPAPVVPTGGTPASAEREIASFEEANQALEEWLKSQG